MQTRRSTRILAAATLAAAAGLPISALAQDGQPAPSAPAAAPAVPAASAAPAPAPAPGLPPDGTIRFNFKDAPFDQVLDFFARESGLPPIYEAEMPKGTMTFISPEAYTFDDALTILNLNLLPKGVQLVKERNYLYLRTLKDSARRASDVVSTIPAGVRPEEIINLTIPLSNARADLVAEQLKTLVSAEYGAITAVPAQNMVIVVETAAQCRRIQQLVQAIDTVKAADSATRIFKLNHAKAEAVFNALKGLVGEKRTTVVFDKQGNKQVLQEDTVAGLNLQPDARTNSIIAVGPETRIAVVEELIGLLDVPEGAGGDQGLRSFILEGISAQEAAKQLNALFAGLEGRKPTIIPSPEQARVTVVAPPALMAQAVALLGEIDPAGQPAGRQATPDRRAAVIKLTYITPQVLEQLAPRLLSQRQQSVLKFGPSPDGRGIVVTGPDADVTAFEQLARGLDVAPDFAKEIRQVRLSAGDSRAILERAMALHRSLGRDQTEPIQASLDPDSRTVTIIGGSAGIERFAELLRTTEAGLAITQESRSFQLKHARPSDVAHRLTAILRPLLDPADGRPYAEPAAEPVDELKTLIVRAQPAQFAVIEKMVQRLDEGLADKSLRIIPVSTSRAEDIRKRALDLYAAQAPQGGPVEVSVDESANSLLVVADADAMQRFMRIMDELQKQTASAREVRLLELRSAKAATVKAFLDDLVRSSGALRIRGGPDPVFEPLEVGNSLMVAAQPSQFAIIETLVKNLDAQQAGERPPIHILRLHSTDAANLAAVLQANYDRRPVEKKVQAPVDVQADLATNTLIVSAAASVLPEIEKIVAELNQQGAFDAEGREIRIFPLKVARAEELARTIDAMYPEPPIPPDPRTRAPRPDLQRPKEVVVRADRGTNSLIVDAPAKRLAGFEQIVQSLDKTQLDGHVELRTYRLRHADLNAAAAAIRSAAASGALLAGKPNPAAAITVDVEPTSRALIVSGPSDAFAGVEDVLKQIDAQPERPLTGVKMYALKSSRAERIQPLLQKVLVGRVREQLQASGKPDADAATLVDVVSDAGSNTIMISAPEQTLAIADALIQTIDQQGGGLAELRVFRLTKGDSAGVARAISASLAAEASGDTAPTITPEPASNSIVIVGTARQLERAGKLIEQLDAKVDSGGVGVRTIKLRYARAEAVQPMLDTLLKKPSIVSMLPSWQVGDYLARTGGRTGDEVRVAADRAMNAIIISAPVAALDMAEEIVQQLDVQPAQPAQDRPVRIITLANADAAELAESVQAVLGDPRPGEEPATVRVDKGSNSLIVRGSTEQLASIEALAARLDQATIASARQMRMVPLDRSRADAALMAQTLKRLLEQQGGIKVEVITADELLKPQVPAAPIAHPISAPPPAPATDSKKQSDASPARPEARAGHWLAVLPALAALALNDEPVPQQGPDQPGVTIAVDPATNSLIVVGSPRMTDRVAALASRLQDQLPAEPSKVHIVEVPAGADCDGLCNLVRTTVATLGRAGPQNPGGLTGPVAVTPDPSGSAMIVWANDTDFACITDLVRALASLGDGGALTIKVIPLITLSAPRAIQAANDLLSPRPQGRQAQRLRGGMDLVMMAADGSQTQARLDPALVRMTADPSGSSIIVAAPAATLPAIERFISLIDQSPVSDRLAIRRYDLRNARAQDLAPTIQQLFDAQRQGAPQDTPQARFIADPRTNTLLVTAGDAQHRDVARVLETMDVRLADSDLKLEFIPLQNAQPTTVQRIVEQVVIGRNPALKDRVQLSAQDGSSIFVVRAPAEQLAEIREIVARVDASDSTGLPVRFVKLERADAQAVAAALTQFFRDRAAVSSRTGRAQQSRVAITGDRRSGTLIVSCTDEDFAQLQSLVQTFDAPSKTQAMNFHIVPLQNARVTDIQDTVQSIANELQYERMGGGYFWSPWGPSRNADQGSQDKIFVQTNERTNSVVLFGQGETLDTMLKVIAELDRPQAEQTRLVVRTVAVERGDLRAIADVIRQVTATPGWRTYRGPDPDAVAVQVDPARRLLLLIGKAPRVAQAADYIAQLKGAGQPDAVLESISLKHAQAPRAAETLRRVFAERAQSQGLPADAISVIGSADGNLLVLNADPETLKLARDLLGLIDQPELGKDRQIDIAIVRNREADEIANLVRAQFPRGQSRAEAQVIITPQPSTNSIIISAQADDVPQIRALIAQLDTPPTADMAKVVTVPLKSARAEEVAGALRTALPQGLKVRITPIRRNNTLLITGSEETVKVVLDQIARIDVELERPLTEVKRARLKHALASEVVWTLDSMLRARPRSPGEPDATVDFTRADNTITFSGTPDQVRDIEKMLEVLDVPADSTRKTEFVKLEFARAEATAKALEVFYGRYATAATTPGARGVTIVPDPASNSLVISAEESEWDGLRGLLKKLDSEEYDTSRQLAVIPLRHADAASVARALNEGFRAPVESRLRQQQQQQRQNRGNRGNSDEGPEQPLVLVDSEPTPTVSAEPQTNALVVFAGRQDMIRIRALVQQIDIPDFLKFPEAHIVPLASGKASLLAASIRELFVGQQPLRPGGPRATVIIGDDNSNSLIIRAEEADFAQIKAIADVLQQQGDKSRATVRIVALRNVPAARLQKSLSATFAQAARQQNEVLSIEVDRTSNSLVVASSGQLFEQIEKVARELDGALPAGGDGQPLRPGAGLGQSVFIIDVQNNSPEEVRKQLEQLGVTRPQSDDRPGVVSEAVTIVPLASRRALAVIASPKDGEALVALVRALDAEPAAAEQKVCIVGLKVGTASAVVATLKAMLDPSAQASKTGPAEALAEQVRRLSIARNNLEKGDLVLDISRPIRLIPDDQTNSIIVASTEANAAAVCEVIKTLDTLPMGDAVIVRMFPLGNASATRAKGVIDDLFRQGEALRRLPGTRRQGLPTTATGKALAGEIAVSVDERTNTLIVAGRDEAVALVEVLMKDLDSDQAAKWVEPSLIPLKNADAAGLAQTLRQVLIQGLTITPEAVGLQKQIGRLRMARAGRDMADPQNRIEADLFAPLSGLVIAPEPHLNALIVVGSPANTQVVRELAAMLDVEAASAANTVRMFPLQHAAADRVSAMIADIFRQRQADPAARPEDRVIITPDMRTNALVVSTSPRSFSIIEAMLRTLDTDRANNTVALHVLPVVGADAQTLAPKIARLMQERISATQRSGEVRSPLDAFSIEADPANNLLIIASSEENMQLVKELVGSLAQGNPGLAATARTDLILLKSGRAVEIAQTLRQIYVDKENSKRGQGTVNVVPSERLNALVVTGTDQDVEAIRRLVDRQESADILTVQDIRRIGLRSANALEVVTLLQNVVAGRTVAGSADIAARQATNIRFFRDQVAQQVEDRTGAPPTEAQIDGAIREQVTLTPDLRTNSVMVKAPAPMMRVIQDMIEDLDTTSAGARRIEKFTLKNADVRAMADLLRDIFTLRQQGSKYVLVPTSQPSLAGGEQGPSVPSEPTVTPVPDERQELAIAIDARTNTLIVSGTQEYLERVRELVEDLDHIEATERTSEVYSLRNAQAKEIEQTLQSYFRNESSLQRSTLSPDQTGSVMRQLEQEVTVVGDEKSNKLVISTSPRYMEMVMSMVRELDAAPPQVVIQVLLAEVTLDSSNSWGADFKLKHFGGDDYNFSSLAAGAGVAAALGIPNLTFASTDFSLVLRALEAQGKLTVLSRPHVMARNNQEASIQVGDNIALVSGALERTPQGGTVSNVERKDIGIILTVKPSINPDGYVRMELSPEISSLSTRTTQISQDFFAPIIQKRTITTTITVKDGQTAVIGGLIQTTDEERRTKTPALGDVPILGWLFRTKQQSDVRTELLIILTPRVIRTDSEESQDRLRQVTEHKINLLQDPALVRDAVRHDLPSEDMEVTPGQPAPPAPPARPGQKPDPEARPTDSETYTPSSKGRAGAVAGPDPQKRWKW
jgi:type II secretion system protein D